jgi:PKD repeat protein
VSAKLAVDHEPRLTSQAVTVDASGSSQPLGAITSYEWDLDGDGTYEVTDGPATETLRFAEPGAHTVGLRVVGRRGRATASTTRVLNIQPSAAVLRSSTAIALTGQPVSLDAIESALADSVVSDYSWDLDGEGTYERDTGPVGPPQSFSILAAASA